MNETLVVGDALPAERVPEATDLSAARAWSSSHADDGRPGSSASLARLLVELEDELERERPGRVVLVDDSDASLAAAIVAAKLLIPVEAAPAAAEGAGVNSRLISQLASAYTAQR